MGINYFSSEEDQKEFHESLIKGYENHIRFIERVIKHKKDMIQIIKKSPLPEDKDRLKMLNAQVKTENNDLKVLREKLIKEQIRYNERFQEPETIKERALKKGLTVIRGGALQ